MRINLIHQLFIFHFLTVYFVQIYFIYQLVNLLYHLLKPFSYQYDFPGLVFIIGFHIPKVPHFHRLDSFQQFMDRPVNVAGHQMTDAKNQHTTGTDHNAPDSLHVAYRADNIIMFINGHNIPSIALHPGIGNKFIAYRYKITSFIPKDGKKCFLPAYMIGSVYHIIVKIHFLIYNVSFDISRPIRHFRHLN